MNPSRGWRFWLAVVVKGAVALAVATVLASLAWTALQAGFSELRELRQLERTPRSLVGAVLPGEVNLLGEAVADGPLLTAPDSGAATLYYAFTEQRRKRNSEGEEEWETVRSLREFTRFRLRDDSGEIRVLPTADVDFRGQSKHFREQGDRRYSETRIDPGDTVFVFGYISGEPAAVRFDALGQYVPIISNRGEHDARSGMAGTTLFLLWLGLALLGAAVYLVLWALRVHLSVIYLAALSAVMAGTLISLGTATAREDLVASYERTSRDVRLAEQQVRRWLAEAGVSWDGDWHAVGGDATARLDARRQRLLAHLRQRIAIEVARTLAVRRQWPEWAVAPFLDLPTLPVVPALDAAAGEPIERVEIASGTDPMLSNALALLCLLAAIALAWFGFRAVRLKRTIENLPTSRTAGAAYGLVELRGRAVLSDAQPALTGPLTGRPCVWYHYLVEELRGSGKNRRWVTIENRRLDRRFWLEDTDGRLPVDPAGAETVIDCRRRKRQGRLRYTEHRIEPGTPIYVLGSAEIDAHTGSSLAVGRGPASQPFVLSDLDERELMLRKARTAFLFLNGGVAGGNAAALAALGAGAALHGAGFLLAALTPLGFFAVFLAVVMYNDLVTLRQRVRLAWANIEVSLAKRGTLVPQLQTLLEAYLQHERGLQQALARLRELAAAPLDPGTAGQLLGAEHQVLTRLNLLYESLPELQGSELARQLTRQLIELENEVALMREGYNNAVERYNTRCQQLPEVFLARAFRFQPLEPFRASIEVRALPWREAPIGA